MMRSELILKQRFSNCLKLSTIMLLLKPCSSQNVFSTKKILNKRSPTDFLLITKLQTI